MSEEEIKFFERKYKLWKVLHPQMDKPENRCLICRKRGDQSCPPIRLGLVSVGGENELTFQLVDLAKKHIYVLGFCMEWVKYV
jgi:hypothetical protein